MGRIGNHCEYLPKVFGDMHFDFKLVSVTDKEEHCQSLLRHFLQPSHVFGDLVSMYPPELFKENTREAEGAPYSLPSNQFPEDMLSEDTFEAKDFCNL